MWIFHRYESLFFDVGNSDFPFLSENRINVPLFSVYISIVAFSTINQFTPELGLPHISIFQVFPSEGYPGGVTIDFIIGTGIAERGKSFIKGKMKKIWSKTALEINSYILLEMKKFFLF